MLQALKKSVRCNDIGRSFLQPDSHTLSLCEISCFQEVDHLEVSDVAGCDSLCLLVEFRLRYMSACFSDVIKCL